jgi:predicted phosphoribosyltransferase
LSKIAKESKLYRGEDGNTADVAGRPVVVVDDGSATTPALEVVAMALARHKVESIFLLTPTPPGEDLQGYCRVITVERTAEQAEEAALIGAWYDDRTAPNDDAAAAIVHAYNAERGA